MGARLKSIKERGDTQAAYTTPEALTAETTSTTAEQTSQSNVLRSAKRLANLKKANDGEEVTLAENKDGLRSAKTESRLNIDTDDVSVKDSDKPEAQVSSAAQMSLQGSE
jgi:hypothetical protein